MGFRGLGVVVGTDGCYGSLCWLLLVIWYCVVLYASWYSWSEGSRWLVFLLTSFSTGMVIVMASAGVIELFVGWEVIGICS